MKKSIISIVSGLVLLTCLSFSPLAQTASAKNNENIHDGGGTPAPGCNNKGVCHGTN
ncbi:hypothetical protein P9D39_06095 [Heyndrickxia oleronia]|jgi:hypothetical protein|uniref:hypothetical protein n=1 Tax=Heyndrickxia oleronia TaxID=38875 RepID=UPI000ADDC312|nr:hypothetical protein [Heyndrickxia oleronia]MEC1373875.1 hypothetical protein [Heyndrickxia oleronia]QQZ03506.1 hypothetical protein I5818_17330 [Heyndrickxia oleronia]